METVDDNKINYNEAYELCQKKLCCSKKQYNNDDILCVHGITPPTSNGFEISKDLNYTERIIFLNSGNKFSVSEKSTFSCDDNTKMCIIVGNLQCYCGMTNEVVTSTFSSDKYSEQTYEESLGFKECCYKKQYTDADIISVSEVNINDYPNNPFKDSEYPPPTAFVKLITLVSGEQVPIYYQHYFWLNEEMGGIQGNLSCPICDNAYAGVEYRFSLKKYIK
jgi:hypothetical protein